MSVLPNSDMSIPPGSPRGSAPRDDGEQGQGPTPTASPRPPPLVRDPIKIGAARPTIPPPAPRPRTRPGHDAARPVPPAATLPSPPPNNPARPASDPPHPVELRPPLADVLQGRRIRRWLLEHAERDIGRVGPELCLHVGAELLLPGEIGRVEPGGAQRFHLRIGRPAEPALAPLERMAMLAAGVTLPMPPR